MNKTIDKRSELVFLYDIRDGNPNGDPMDENKPRIDIETGLNIVTDVRLKRTIRDYLHDALSEEILVRTIHMDGKLAIQDAKTRAMDFCDKSKKDFMEKLESIRENILKECIDVRLFGTTLPIEMKDGKKDRKTSFTRTGPVQFNIGRSLHKVDVIHIKGTGAFASKAGDVDKEQQTFRDEFILHYSLISFHGLINENTAKHTLLTDNDVNLLMNATWNGTKSLISRTKIGQMPRLLIRVEYETKNFHIGDLDKGFKLISELNDVAIRGPDDYYLDASVFLNTLSVNKEAIANVYYKIDPAVKFQKADKEILLPSEIKLAIGEEPIEMEFQS